MLSPRLVPIGLLAALAVVGVACSGDDDATAPTTTAAPVPTTAATTTTTMPATTTTTSTSTTTTTTTTPTTTLPTPIAPPADTRSEEPIVELALLEIPAIDVSMTMYEGIRLTTLDRGPGHWPGTAVPGGPGNVVVAGHRTSGHQVFRNVDQLVPGDEIVFTDTVGRHVYRVTGTEVVKPTALWIVDQTPTPTATLFACHPPGSTAERIVVFAELVT